ncbi:MAG: patatin-like phospholipase family protein [Byssovorax sp.]
MMRTPWLRPTLLTFSLILAPGCSLEAFYVGTSYPEKSPPIPSRNWPRIVSAALEPSLLAAYDDPARVASCLTGLDRGLLAGTFAGYGQCLDTFPPTKEIGNQTAPTTRADAVTACLPELTWARPGKGIDGCSLERNDAVALTHALASTAESFHSLKKSLDGGGFGDLRLSTLLDQRLRDGLDASLDLAARLLAAEAPPGGVESMRRSQLPALALSGGSANGAFTAGYLHAMLQLRELAVEKLDPGFGAEIEKNERIGSIVSTSVGTLAALAVDLYFTPDAFSASPGWQAVEDARLRVCLADDPRVPLPATAPLGKRPFQRCALKELVDDFRAKEWDLLCYEDRSLLDLMSSLNHVLQFQPLKTRILAPVLDAFQQRMLDNDLVRVAMTVDFDQNVVVGLDERACRLGSKPAWRTECLSSAALASVVLPVFTRPIEVVYSGLLGQGGEKGTWIDGGVRSETPTFRALAMTRKKVLAINTGRAEGIPSRTAPDALGITLATMGQFTAQVRSDEIALSPTKCAADDDDQRLVEGYLNLPGGVLTASVGQPLTGKLRTVYVPEEIKPTALFADGYAFDPWVMRGLFLWGERTFLRSRRAGFAWLGWETMRDLESSHAQLEATSAICKRSAAACIDHRSGAAAYREAASKLVSDVEAELHLAYNVDESSDAFKSWYTSHKRDRRKAMDKNLESCKKE